MGRRAPGTPRIPGRPSCRSFLCLGIYDIFPLKVDCYDILGETDVKTEATLRVRLEQARDCTPCLLVLRNLEALSQSTQVPEPGKGTVFFNSFQQILISFYVLENLS